MRAVVYDRYGSPDVLRIEEVERPVPEARRGPHQDPCHHGQPDGLRLRQGKPFFSRSLHRAPSPEEADPRQRAGRRGRGRRRGGDRAPGRRPAFGATGFDAHVQFAASGSSSSLTRGPRRASRRRQFWRWCDLAMGLLGKGRSPAVRSILIDGRLRGIDRNRSGAAGPVVDADATAVCMKNLERRRLLEADLRHHDGGGSPPRTARRTMHFDVVGCTLVQAMSPWSEARRAVRRDRPRVHDGMSPSWPRRAAGYVIRG